MIETLLLRLQAHGDRPALLGDAGSATYEELRALISRQEREAEARGWGPGTVVAVPGDFSPANVAWWLALSARAVTVALTGSAAGDELERRLSVVGTWEVADRPPPPQSRPRPRPPLLTSFLGESRPGLVLFSSGTTGEPKAVLHDAQALFARYLRRPAGRDWRVLGLLGFDHIGGVDLLLRALVSGGAVVTVARRAPDLVAAAVERHGVEVLPASPTMLNLLLMTGAPERFDWTSLEIIAYGAERMSEDLLARVRAAWPEVRLQQKFGTSETSTIGVRSEDHGSTWMKVEDEETEWQVKDGELWLRSPTTMLGYLNADNDRLRPDGWYCTGDMVEMRADGYFRIIGRREEVINVGGEKVVPAEIEREILALGGVQACAVYGETNAVTGQIVVADIVFAPPEPSPAEARARIRTGLLRRLPPFKVPVKIRPVRGFKVTERGKRGLAETD